MRVRRENGADPLASRRQPRNKRNRYSDDYRSGGWTGIRASTKEAIIQVRLHGELGGRMEVTTPSGQIDLLTDEFLIEVKNISEWKRGVGQVVVYSVYYPDHKKRIHLFGQVHSRTLAHIEGVCSQLDIAVTAEIVCLNS